MSARHKLLLLDDDDDLLELYREMLAHLPSKPEIHTATSGARAISLLESAPFSLLMSDLNMPRMDGLQVLAIVRRKFPQLRTAVMTSVVDEQFRARAYAMGIDLYLEKPNTPKEISFFLHCIESLLGQEGSTGFRGVQSKSLVDIIQLECLSQSSSVLKITNGVLEGRIWIHAGEIVDSVTQDLTGEAAFHKILSWKAGSFEILPGEPDRPRRITGSYQGLLLETAQMLDETGAADASGTSTESASPLAPLSQFSGVEFLLSVTSEGEKQFDSWGVENAEQLAEWTRTTAQHFRSIGDTLQAGSLNRMDGIGPARQVAIASSGGKELCVGFNRSFSQERIRETMKRIVAKWVS